jgi:hypothetical protein
MNKIFNAVVMLVLLSFSQINYAAVRCNGSVSYLGIDSTGRVFVSVGTTPIHAICNVEVQGTFTIPPKTCSLAYAALLSARASLTTVATYYNNATLTCATLPIQGDAPSAYYVSPTE